MKYDHAVIVNGKFYFAGEEVPEQVVEQPIEEVPEQVVEKVTRTKKK